MQPHAHRYRPRWLLLTSPADVEGWHRIVTHARCIICGEEAYLAGLQSPRAVQTRLLHEGE